ncbi:unnamed protein product [Prorocentrum cordatum]|uniref:Uncharacterized protein n=1 Tax=Prorocentrum cordatum TaxID=2364126 RepID=A0ABN9XDX9_9DINO|nr:unnamed protein product [Polarella glacialis]
MGGVRKPAIPTDDGVRTFAHPDVGRGTVRSGDAPPQCPIRTDYSRTTMKSVREEEEEEEEKGGRRRKRRRKRRQPAAASVPRRAPCEAAGRRDREEDYARL